MFKMCLLWIQAATLFLTLATASALSASSAAPSSSPNDVTTLAGTTGPDHLSIHFNAPCPGCFEDADDDLLLTLEIDSAQEECSTVAPRLNGLPLVASNFGNGVASGQVSLPSTSSSGSSQRDIHASWESTCLNGEASIVSIRVNGIVGQEPLNDTSGFTTSFTQKGKPTLLRLQDKPVDQLSQELCNDWLVSVGQALSIIPVIPDLQSSVDISLQAEYAKLAELQAEMEVLHVQVHATLKRIMSMLRQKFTSCSSMQCVWNTAVKEVSPIANLIVSHFQNHRKLISGCKDGDAQSPCSIDTEHMPVNETFDAASEPVHDELDEANVAQDVSPMPTAAATPHASSSAQPTTRAVVSPSPTDYAQGSYTPSSVESTTPTATSHYGLPHVRPHDGQVDQQRNLGLIIALPVLFVLLIILSGLVIRAIVKFRDPRRRAERAARREERDTKRLYRKAACKHKWRTFWKNLCYRRPGNVDDEEKRQMIIEQDEADDGSGAHKEIRSMRNASEFVRDLVQAEEGRSKTARQARHYPDGFEPAELNGVVGSSRSSDVASYKSGMTPPPRYDADFEGEMVIVDGFCYTSSDYATESSIVDCSPRLSLETGRSTILTKDTRD